MCQIILLDPVYLLCTVITGAELLFMVVLIWGVCAIVSRDAEAVNFLESGSWKR